MVEYCMSLEMTWIFINMCYGADVVDELFFDPDPSKPNGLSPSVVYQFVQQMIKQGDEAQKEMGLFLLANATSDSATLSKSLVAHTDFCRTLYKLADAPTVKLELLKVIIWNVKNLARFELVDDEFLPLTTYICQVILQTCTNEQILTDALAALSSLTKTESNNRLAIIAQGKTIAILTDTLNRSLNSNPQHMGQCCRIICNMLAGPSPDLVIKFLAHDLLGTFNIILAKGIPYHSREVLWGLSNIACSDQQAVDHLVNHQIFQSVQLHMASTDLSVRREALFAISNTITTCHPLKVHGILHTEEGLLRQFLKGLVLISHKDILNLVLDTIEYLGKTDS